MRGRRAGDRSGISLAPNAACKIWTPLRHLHLPPIRRGRGGFDRFFFFLLFTVAWLVAMSTALYFDMTNTGWHYKPSRFLDYHEETFRADTSNKET
jgi:hypothetical protein